MKYIRTKDGKIYDMNNLLELTISQEPYRTADGWLIYKNQIIKESDNIKKLCDEFVMKTHLSYYTNSHLKDLLIEYDKFYIKDDIEIYGAIWTDKGLIYVAKMNESGVLELL